MGKQHSTSLARVTDRYFDLFGIEDNSPEKIYRERGPAIMNQESITWERNGVPWPPEKAKLTWKNLVIDKKLLFHR